MNTLQMPKVDYVENYWYGFNPSMTHFMSALSVLFPDGERFFMKSMNAYREQLSPELKQELNEFCIQEANHGRIHTAMNEKLNTHSILRELEWETKFTIDKYTKFMTRKQKLAVTVCLEHMTAVMGKHLLKRTDMQAEMKSDLKKVWLYHATEEVEHAHVSFDIYKAVGGGYLLRTGLMIPCLIALTLVTSKHWIKIMNYDKKHGTTGFIKALKILLFKNGYITGMKDDIFAWFRTDFHPSQI